MSWGYIFAIFQTFRAIGIGKRFWELFGLTKKKFMRFKFPCLLWRLVMQTMPPSGLESSSFRWRKYLHLHNGFFEVIELRNMGAFFLAPRGTCLVKVYASPTSPSFLHSR